RYLLSSFTATARTAIHTLSLHDALPISGDPAHRGLEPCATRKRDSLGQRELGGFAGRREAGDLHVNRAAVPGVTVAAPSGDDARDRKSTRLNSSHQIISYAVFCLKKKIQ